MIDKAYEELEKLDKDFTDEELAEQRHTETLDALEKVLLCQKILSDFAGEIHKRTDRDYYCEEWLSVDCDNWQKSLDMVKEELTSVQEYLDREWMREVRESQKSYDESAKRNKEQDQ